MFCGNCGRNVPDHVAFCPGCGTPMAQRAPAAQNSLADPEPVAAAPAAAPESVYCPGCGQPSPAGTAVCGYCGTPLSGMRESRTPGTKGSKKLWLIIGAAVALVAALLIVAFTCGWIGSKGPSDDVWNGAEKTVFSDNFTMDISNGAQTITYKVAVDEDDNDVTLYGEQNGEIMALYKDYMIGYSSYYDEYTAEYIGDSIEQFFAAYDGVEDGIEWEELLDQIAGPGGYSQASQYIDFKELDKFTDEVWDNFNDKAWLEENLNYQKDGDTHIIQVNVYTLLNALAADAKNVFYDEYMYEEMMDELRNLRSSMAITLEARLTVDGGKLTKIQVSPVGMGNGYGITVDFYDIGSTSIDTAMLDRILGEAQKD